MSRICNVVGHRYEPRYSLVWPARVTNIKTSDPDTLDRFKDKIYHGDVCTSCGRIINSPAGKEST